MYYNTRFFTVVAAAVAALFLGVNSASAQVSGISGPGGYNVAVMWFLGPGITSCCTGLTNLYYAQAAVSITNNSGDPAPTVIWYTDTPGSVQITPGSGGLTAELTALAPSTHMTYDINVWATVDGVQTANLPIFIDTPVSVSNAGPVNQTGGCQSLGYPVGYPGYVTIVTNSVADLSGMVTITKIDLHETLEHEILLQTGSNWGLPTASMWPATSAYWTSNTTYVDYLSACGPSSGMVPQQVNYNLNSSTPILSDTQKFWVGSLTGYSGECVEIDDTEYLRDSPLKRNRRYRLDAGAANGGFSDG